MLPLLPGRFSTKKRWLNMSDSSAATSRPRMSALPPAPNATTTRTGWEGHSSARAEASVASEREECGDDFQGAQRFLPTDDLLLLIR